MVDENVERLAIDDNPQVVGISVKVDTLDRAVAIARTYRRRGVKVVMGGIHATACPEDCLDEADAVVVGEAEESWRSRPDIGCHFDRGKDGQSGDKYKVQ
jgi:radical SAM superfamily enzyme YgiQ (UPF0313 family)